MNNKTYDYKKEFFYLKQNIYLNWASTSIIPKTLIQQNFLLQKKMFWSIDRDKNKQTFQLEQQILNIRKKIISLFNTNYSIVFTNGITDIFNDIINSLMIKILLKKIKINKIIITNSSHNSIFLPLLKLSKMLKIKLSVVKIIDEYGNLKTEFYKIIKNKIEDNTLFVIPYICNVTGHKLIWKNFKILKKNTIAILDFAQGFIEYLNLNNIEKIKFNFDIIITSTHKFFGPKKFGFMCIKKNIYKKIFKHGNFFYKMGGGGITDIKHNYIKFKKIPQNWEVGTFPLLNIFKTENAIKYIKKSYLIMSKNINLKYKIKIINTLKKWYKYIYIIDNKLTNSSIITCGLLTGNLHDLENYLLIKNIYIRTGNFCNNLLTSTLNKKIKNTLFRISWTFLTPIEHINIFLNEIIKYLILETKKNEYQKK